MAIQQDNERIKEIENVIKSIKIVSQHYMKEGDKFMFKTLINEVRVLQKEKHWLKTGGKLK